MKLIESVIIQNSKHTIRITVRFCLQSLQQQKNVLWQTIIDIDQKPPGT
jgi:hypothetical protein